MQYLLTEKEYEDLQTPQELVDLREARTYLLEQFCKVAKTPCTEGNTEESYDHYCDDCPLSELALYKLGMVAGVVHNICNKFKQYSK
jgi:hypothetical protein